MSVPQIAGISGGRTSALMATMLDPECELLFCNTGREHPGTYEFLRKLDAHLHRPIVWLEMRPPAEFAAPPRFFRFEVVTFETADRTGQPFRDYLRCMADFRRVHKGKDPIAPWARQRTCTAYMKNRVMANYAVAKGYDAFDIAVGLRHDEQHRIVDLRARSTGKRAFFFPLDEAKKTKADVLAYWRAQSFDLEIEEHQGNCTGCFLKDQSDLSRVLGEEATDKEFWFGLERDYPDFGGQRFPGYVQLDRERPTRLAIEAALRAGKEPVDDGRLEPRRFRNVVIQERKRLAGEIVREACDAFSCGAPDPEEDEEAVA